METKDFRVGNIIEYECTYHKISMIFRQSVRSYWLGAKEHFIKNSYDCSISDIKPIPLTEEILLKIKNVSLDESNAKFEFRKIYKLGAGNLKFEILDSEIAVYFMDNLICFKKYLHQLQNMIYSNWEIELEINL